jgi:hypothetical protein
MIVMTEKQIRDGILSALLEAKNETGTATILSKFADVTALCEAVFSRLKTWGMLRLD